VSPAVVAQGDIAPAHADALREMYLNTAANVDRAIGELLSRVRETLGREPGVVVLADHGESLYDEAFLGHGYVLNEVQTRIPLVVHNLPLAIEEPFGQADLRGLLRHALSRPGTTSAPTLRRGRAKRVFQYLGALERPASIAFVTADGRVTLDLRSRRIDFGSGEWRATNGLTGDERRIYLDLVHTWERMLLAGPRGGSPADTR
jgi:hypothetical protein